jgi:hypothetical protein
MEINKSTKYLDNTYGRELQKQIDKDPSVKNAYKLFLASKKGWELKRKGGPNPRSRITI